MGVRVNIRDGSYTKTPAALDIVELFASVGPEDDCAGCVEVSVDTRTAQTLLIFLALRELLKNGHAFATLRLAAPNGHVVTLQVSVT